MLDVSRISFLYAKVQTINGPFTFDIYKKNLLSEYITFLKRICLSIYYYSASLE